MSADKARRIAALNDLFRLNFFVTSFGPRPVPVTSSARGEYRPCHRKTKSASGAKCRVSMTFRKATTPTPNVISARSTCRVCPRRFSGRSIITRTGPARSALKTLPIRRNPSACSPSCWPRSIRHGTPRGKLALIRPGYVQVLIGRARPWPVGPRPRLLPGSPSPPVSARSLPC